jgi:excisionase family DNA binding protein
MSENLLSPAEAATIAGVHKDTVRRAVHFGLLKAQKVGRVFAITPEHLQEWINAGMPNHRRKSTRKVKLDNPSSNQKEGSEPT